MRSFPSPGDGLARALRAMHDEIKRLAYRQATLAQKLANLEARLEDLEES